MKDVSVYGTRTTAFAFKFPEIRRAGPVAILLAAAFVGQELCAEVPGRGEIIPPDISAPVPGQNAFGEFPPTYIARKPQRPAEPQRPALPQPPADSEPPVGPERPADSDANSIPPERYASPVDSTPTAPPDVESADTFITTTAAAADPEEELQKRF